VHPSVWEFIENSRIPVLGICYGMQEIVHHFGGIVSPSQEREFGRAFIELTDTESELSRILFENVNHSQMWMSHGDKVTLLPEGTIHTLFLFHRLINDSISNKITRSLIV
jgi:GMP synthase (glutamine-hydrolysing)